MGNVEMLQQDYDKSWKLNELCERAVAIDPCRTRLLLLLAFGLCSLRKSVFVRFTADVLVLDVSLCQAFALKLASLMLAGILFFFFFFLGYRIVVYSFQAKEPSGHQTNLRYAGTTAKCACNRRSVHRKKSP